VDEDKKKSNEVCIKYKWVFDIKRDGTFRARLVACGYSQVPGVDFQESYSPVINDVVFRILIVCQIIWGLTVILIDVEVAFLNGDLDEII
jgi:Reverse transcriptase (RNA-dependent DNA polymerase)